MVKKSITDCIKEERPLQIIGAINAYHALLAKASGFKAIYLAGGGSMLRGLDKRISTKTDLPVYIAEDPLQAVVRGTGIALKNIDLYKTILLK